MHVKNCWIFIALIGLLLCGHAAGATERNLLRNPGFEAGSDGWRTVSSERYSIVTGAAKSGQAGLKYHQAPGGPKDENAHYDQVVQVEPNTIYVASASFASPTGLRPTLRVASEDWETLGFTKPRQSDGWQRVRVMFRTADMEKVRFQIFGGATIHMRGTWPGTSFCDDAMLRKLRPEERNRLLRPRVNIDAGSPTGQINRRFFGVNTLFTVENDKALADGKIARLLREMPCHLLRYPGGEMADNYLWKSHELANPDEFPAEEGPHTTDTDEFIELCRQVGAEPIFVVNLDTGLNNDDVEGAAEYAAQWVHYCNVENDYNVRYWEIGNETYLPCDADPPRDPSTYAAAFRTFAEEMKAVDPDIKVGAVGPTNPRSSGGNSQEKDRKPWWPVVCRRVGDEIDFAIMHGYIGGGDIDLRRLPTSVPRVDRMVQTLDDYLQETLDRRVPIALTEWNVGRYIQARHMASAVMLAEYIGRFVEAGVDMGALWPLRWPGGRNPTMQLLDHDTKDPQTPYKVMKLFSSNLGGTLLASTETADDLYSIASRSEDGSEVTVFVVNKPIIPRDRTVALSLRDFEPESARAVALAADHPQEEEGVRRRLELTRSGDRYTFRVQPFSVVMVKFSR